MAFITLASASLSFAASVAGVVSHYKSGNPYGGAKVTVMVGGDRYVAKTDAYGNYFIEIPDSRLGQEATLYAEGVKVKEFPVQNAKSLNVKFR